ncbi:uncharacterized protein LOC117538592 [Gymnodraco acuticeps]|uniref:Uncharacterized protein LOC117538592 n=1 Tax=Gymnodraco acuticeps TaxID=8218 RepID=A0A6P8TX19_GYMAC|nr:uncharacterized protein LOC117538592 [Gymnodraco acuticeps]
MNVRHTLICFLLLTLRDGNSGLLNAQNLDRTETEGGNFRVSCSFTFSGGRKLFCKGKCEEGNILVETTGDSEQRGRYSIRYNEGTLLSYAILYVGITKLTKSDAGRYQCGLDRSFLDSYQDIEIRVTDDPPVEPEYGVEANQVYEDVRGSGSPPVLISTIYSYAKYTKLNGVETTDEYSFVTAATSQKKTKDDPININYSEVDSSNSGAASLHSAPCGDADNILLGVEARSDVSHASPPPCSTVNSDVAVTVNVIYPWESTVNYHSKLILVDW